MGQGIAAANVKRGIPVACSIQITEALARGVQGVLSEVAYNKQLKGPDVKRAVEFAPLVNGTLSDIELCHSDIIVEAIVEKRDAKQQLFARLEPLMRDDAILARTRRRSRSRSSPTGWNTRSASAGCTFSTRCGRCRWSR